MHIKNINVFIPEKRLQVIFDILMFELITKAIKLNEFFF
jgi:hypothetical protein